jgi:hypothetical protein
MRKRKGLLTSMGAKTAVLCSTDGEPAELLRGVAEPDQEATSALIAQTSPGWDGQTTRPGSLGDHVFPDQGTAYAGVYPGIQILCDQQVMVDRPSQLPGHLLQAGAHRRRTILHVMHSATDWFAFAVWDNGSLVRSLSLSAGDGVIEDVGSPLDFERPYWAGEHPVAGDYPLPFHPLDLGGESALRALLGFIVEGKIQDTDIDAYGVPLLGFQVPVTDAITKADIQEFMRTHTRRRARLGPGGILIPIEE